MGDLIYTAIASLDGFVADESGGFGWAAPDEQVHAFVNELERPAGTYLYGRRTYEVMRFWEGTADDPGLSPVTQDYGRLWRAADKVVYSSTLPAATTARSRLERTFDPDAVRRMKAEAERPISIGGPVLAAAALRAGLVDEIRRLVVPAVVGGGLPFLPAGLPMRLELTGERTFASGWVALQYRVVR